MNLSAIGKKIRQYPILFVCGIVTPLLLIILFMRGPKLSDLEEEVARLEREWQNMQRNLERSSRLPEQIEELEASLDDINQRLMRVEEVALNSEFFYNLERQAGITFSRFSQGSASNGEALSMPEKRLEHFSVIPYNIGINGKLEELLSFADLLERQDPIIRIESMSLTRVGTESGDPFELSGTIECYALAEKHE